MKTGLSLLHACFIGSTAVVLPALFASACSPDEKVNPATVGGASSSSSSSSGEAGQGGMGSGGQGHAHGGAAGAGGQQGGAGGTSGSGGMAGGGGASASSSSSSSGGQTGGAGGMGGMGGSGSMDGGPSDGSITCPTTTMAVPLQPGIHVAACSPVTYSTNPPTSGSHYPSWAAFKWYSSPVPRGYTVHSMEHGAVVISYNCPNGCTDELGTLAAFLDARPADPKCVAPLKARIIVTPDPLLDTKFAAAAWGAFYKGDCFDFTALGAFLDMYYAKAPEDFCFDGIDVTHPDAGVPGDCGSATDAGTD